MPEWIIHILETPEEMTAVEDLQRLVWTAPDIEIVPKDLLLAVVHNGGLAIGAFVGDNLVGVSFGFPGFYTTPDGPRLKHHSHILAVHPDWRSKGIGFALKRAQWQMVRKQGLDRITWTYDLCSVEMPISTLPSWARFVTHTGVPNMAKCAMA